MNNPAHNANRNLLKLADNFLLKLKDGPLAIAVSGGSDSMAVLDLLIKANSQNRKLYCFTVDHQLRKEAKLEAQFVADFCSDHQITHQTLVWNGDKPTAGIQTAARWARYQLLNNACQDVGAIGLVTAHNLDDQLETVFMRMQRDKTGEGIGLSGMAPTALFYRSMWVFRPFLFVRKQQLKEHLLKSSIDWREDPSNVDEKFERVRVRQNADLDFDLGDIKANSQKRKNLSDAAAKYINQHCETSDGFVFHLTISDHQQRTLEKVLQVLAHVIGGRDRSLSRDDVISLYDFATSDGDMRKTMGRVVLNKSGKQLQIYRENRGFENCHIDAGKSMKWDGRFLIHNLSENIGFELKQNDDELGCPPIIRWQGDEEWSSPFDHALVRIRPYINKYDQVLSEFDFQLANSIAQLLGRSEFLLPFDNAKEQIQ